MVASPRAEKKQSSLFLFGPIRYIGRIESPSREPEPALTESAFVPVLPLAELQAGQMRCIEVGAVSVLVVHTKDGQLHAVHNICSHAYARMDEGRLRGNRLICPLHGASFDVRSGAVLGAPANAPLPSYPVRVVDGRIEVQV
jgi:3-phenylpropionate/trans-cinnamate dioxygenase ferredoxin subunit